VAAVVGRLCDGKGLETAVRAAKIVAERVPAFRLVIVGDGELRQPLAALAQEIGAEGSVVMVGARHDVPDILRSVDLLAMASESETSGLVAMEAAAAGIPVVATRVGGLPETVQDGVTGVMVPPRDAPALARAVVSVLEDRNVGERMGEAARGRARREFGAERLVETMAAVYSRILNDGDGGR